MKIEIELLDKDGNPIILPVGAKVKATLVESSGKRRSTISDHPHLQKGRGWNPFRR